MAADCEMNLTTLREKVADGNAKVPGYLKLGVFPDLTCLVTYDGLPVTDKDMPPTVERQLHWWLEGYGTGRMDAGEAMLKG